MISSVFLTVLIEGDIDAHIIKSSYSFEEAEAIADEWAEKCNSTDILSIFEISPNLKTEEVLKYEL